MSLAKATFSGRVYREPQLRSTTNNVPITYFTFDIGTQDNEELIRVRAIGNLAEVAEKSIVKDDYLVVEGNLALATIKDETGLEKKIVDLNLVSFEKITAQTISNAVKKNQDEDIVKFATSVSEDLIPDSEIPF